MTERNAGESADYLDAREEHARLERRISELEQRLLNATVVEPDAGNGGVDVGERIRLRDLATDEIAEYELVSSLESDPAAGRLSAASPVGRAVLGRRKGGIAAADAPEAPLRDPRDRDAGRSVTDRPYRTVSTVL